MFLGSSALTSRSSVHPRATAFWAFLEPNQRRCATTNGTLGSVFLTHFLLFSPRGGNQGIALTNGWQLAFVLIQILPVTFHFSAPR